MSGEDMYMSGMRGKCLSILNIHRDNLCTMGEKSVEMPNIPILMQSRFDIKDSYQENFPGLGASDEPVATREETKVEEAVATEEAESSNVVSMKALEISDKEVEVKEVSLEVDEDDKENSEDIDHDKILMESFQCAIRFKSKDFKLPVIVSTFMKVMQSCW